MTPPNPKFTPENRGALLERFSAGLSLPDAARAVGVNATTVKTWITRGNKETEGDYHDFAVAVDGARQSAKDRPPPLTEEEFQRRLDQAVVAGSVSAMKLWDDRARRTEPAKDEPTSKIASLAEARRRKGA
jgi:hypothetical protein